MNIYLAAIIGITVINLIPLLVILLAKITNKNLERITKYLVSFAAGALLGNALLHIIPEVYTEEIEDPLIASIAIVTGIVIFYILEQYLRWQHCHEGITKTHKHPVAVMNIIGDAMHNLIDGILIASSFMIDYQLGIATVLAVILHEIPQELGDLGILLHAKWDIKKIVIFNILTGLIAFVGLGIGFLFSNSVEGFSAIAIAVTGGGFIYIACTDLLPDLHGNGGTSIKARLLQLFFLIIGIAIFLVL